MATYYHGNSEIQGADGLQQTLILMNPNFVGFSDTNPPPPPSSPANYILQHAPSQFHATPHLQPQPQQLVGIPLQQSVVASGPTSSAASQSPSTDHVPRHREISTLHGYPASRLNYSDLWNNLAAAGSMDTRDSTRSQQGLSLSLYTQQQSPSYGSRGNDHRPHEFPSPRAAPTLSQPPPPGGGGGEVRVPGYLSAAGLSGGVAGVLNILLGSKYLKAAQELLEEVVSVGHGIGAELLKKTGGGQLHQQNRGSPATGGTGEGLTTEGEGKLKGGDELTTLERQEIQMKKAKLITLLDEVEQRYRQYHHQMQAVISSFEQAAGLGSAKTYTALALRTISKQFRSLKDAILGQVKAANESLGEEENHHKGSVGGNTNTGTSTTEGSTRLKFIDHQIRQQRALQQLGMMHNNAWRPQRGLPEKAVTVLRAWLFEHFLHPYPKDSDKIMLAKHTGLTRSQVSNWFINARVRLWKPMIEEMYSEEIKEQEQNTGSEDHKTTSLISPKEDHPSTSKSISQDRSNNSEENQIQMNGNSTDHKNNPPPMTSVSTTPTTFRGINPPHSHSSSTQNQPGFSLLSPSEMEILSQASPKRQRSTDQELRSSPSTQVVPMMDHMDNANSNGASNGEILINFGDNHGDKERSKGYHHHHYQRMQEYPTNFLGGFGSYPIGEIGRFDAEQFPQRFSGNGSVSLTLGLPHCENNHHHHHHQHLSLSETNQSFLPTNQDIQFMRGRRDDNMGDHHTSNDFGDISDQTPSHSMGGYESINIQEQKGYAAQLLPDFMA